MPDTPIRILNAQIPALLQGLSALDGRKEVVEVDTADGKTKRLLNTVPFVFSGKARLTAGKWIAALRTQSEILNKVHDDLVRQYATKDNPTTVAPENEEKFRAEMASVDVTPFEVSLPAISFEDLNAETNKLPVSVIGVLAPILV